MDKYWPGHCTSTANTTSTDIIKVEHYKVKATELYLGFDRNHVGNWIFCAIIKVIFSFQTEVKEEPLDIDDDPEWERAAEAEILAANEGYLDTPSPEAASARNCPLTRHLTSNYLSSFMN